MKDSSTTLEAQPVQHTSPSMLYLGLTILNEEAGHSFNDQSIGVWGRLFHSVQSGQISGDGRRAPVFHLHDRPVLHTEAFIRRDMWPLDWAGGIIFVWT